MCLVNCEYFSSYLEEDLMVKHTIRLGVVNSKFGQILSSKLYMHACT